MYVFERLLLTNRPPPMRPPMSHTCRVIWSTSSFVQLGKKSSTLAMMLMKAVGNKMRPIRRAHFPMQHISSCFLLPSVIDSSFPSPCHSSLCTATLSTGIFTVNHRGEVIVTSRGGGGGTLAWPNPTQLSKYHLQIIIIKSRKEKGPTVGLGRRLPLP